jgi:DNA repair photolyase
VERDMEIASRKANSNEMKLEEELIKRYRGMTFSVSELLEQFSHIDSKVLFQGLKRLEENSLVYIERNPRLLVDVLRTDISQEDRIYFETFPSISRKSLLYKTKVEYGDYTINHVVGCAHGCNYPCYAMQMSKRWGRIQDYYEDWMHPRIVSNAMELLEVEIPKMNGDIQFVHLSFMSDPFMYDAINDRNIAQIQDLTMKIIRRLNEDGIKVTVLTKGLLPEELENGDLIKNNEYGITLVSTNDDFHSKFEPFSAPPRKRIEELENRHNAGLRTWVSLEPYPTPNLVEQDLNDLLSEVSFVDKIIFGKWNYYREVNGYSEKESFYTKCVDDVLDFCKTNDIQFHIKNGTPGSNSDTESLFS